MADLKAVDEETRIPEKRQLPSDATLEGDRGTSDSNKKQKIEVSAEKNGTASLTFCENVAESDELLKISVAADEEDGEVDEDEEEYNVDEEDEDGDEGINEEVEYVDRKGKGIIKDVKGKGKVIEDSDDDDSEGHDYDDDGDSSDDSGSGFSDGLEESDMEDDPLAEVDLDNILPSRTRQRRMQPAVRIVNDSDKGNDP